MQTTTSQPKLVPSTGLNRRTISARIAVIVLCLTVSALAVAPFFFMGERDEGQSIWHLRMPDTHDMFLHLDQMKSFYAGLQAKEIYPRWEIETNRGFGAPTTCFYPPGLYYVTGLFYYLSHDWLHAILWSQLAIMIAAAAAMYLYARRSMSRTAALAAMSLYALLPYHLIDQYHRSALAELLGFVWMPLLLMFVEALFGLESAVPAARRVKPPAGPSFDFDESLGETAKRPQSGPPRRSKVLSALGVAFAYGAFIWSHPPTAYQFSLVLGLVIILLAILKRNWRAVLLSGAGIGLGIALAAAYIYPAAAEKNLIRNEFIAESWPYDQSYVLFRGSYYSDNPGFFQLVDRTWILNLAMIAICAVTLIVIARRIRASHPAAGTGNSLPPDCPSRPRILMWTMIGAFALFMMTRPSDLIGRRIPMIDIGVFSWRMLSITTLVAALLGGAIVQYAISAHRNQRRLVSISLRLLFAALAVGVMTFNVILVMGPVYRGPAFEPETEHLNYAMLPKTAPDDPEDLDPEIPPAELLTEDNGTVSADVWRPQHREIRADPIDPDLLLVRTFNYPGWVAHVDGEPAEIRTEGDETDPDPDDQISGRIEIALPGGPHTVVLDFIDTPIRRRGKLITIGAAVLALALLVLAVFQIALKWKRNHFPLRG
jgi:hypothetical protein